MPKVGMPEVRKPQLIRATMQTIHKVGLHKASVAMISQCAGVSPAIINHYFGGKAGLLEATMKTVLKSLAQSITERLQQIPQADISGRIMAVVEGNFDPLQLDDEVVKTWLTFWSYSMHEPRLHRLQQVNEKRLLSFLRRELKRALPAQAAAFHAQGIAALIDGIWLRGALSPQGINRQMALNLVIDYLRRALPQDVSLVPTTDTTPILDDVRQP